MLFIVEAFFSGCISKVINDGKDYSWPKIKSVIKDRHDQNRSTKIYRVIEKSLNIVTDKKFKDTDKLYNAIEKIFIEFKNHGETLESVKCGLNVLGVDASEQGCEIFLEKFYEGIRRDDDLYKAVILDLQQKDIKISQEEFQKINEKLDNLTEIVSREDNNIGIQKREPIKSRTQEYADKWNQNMFLNDFDKRDENAGANVKLSEVYIHPHYIWKKNHMLSTDLDTLLSEYVFTNIKNRMLLILGQPGIGKSTIITWITNYCTEIIERILVYKFASDLSNVEWRNTGEKCNIVNEMLKELSLSYDNLNDKTLIIDGFDEISVGSDREKILNTIYQGLIETDLIHGLSIIITCRENYIRDLSGLKCNYIILQPFDNTQIQVFCRHYQMKTQKKIPQKTMEIMIKAGDILGIPLILYMILALEISIDKDGSIVDVYDQVFSLEGGIYDRCIENGSYEKSHRIAMMKRQIHQLSRDIALWIFENNSDKEYIPQEEYKRLCNHIVIEQKQDAQDVQDDFLIGNFFRLVKPYEGCWSEEIYFVHRSIYEYFVIEYIFDSMQIAVEISKEKLAGVYGNFFKGNVLSANMLYYLQRKIEKSKLNQKFEIINETFQMMLNDGMTYYTHRCFKNVIKCEMNIFYNMLELMHLWGERRLKFNNSITKYLNWGMIYKFNLVNVDLVGVDLSGSNLSNVNLLGVNIIGKDIE